MRVIDKLSLAGIVLIIGLLLYGARHGPIKPILRAANLQPDPAAVAPPQPVDTPQLADAPDMQRDADERAAPVQRPVTLAANQQD